ncbi:MAG TPA: M23 family metallopeptidase [Pyrinomonadaceae bacterium]|jgi:murein DD-endopeptidase MepM/ murein hydrolase activator NlpD
MSLSRRGFLGALVLSAPAVLTGRRSGQAHAQADTGAPLVTNYNATGRPVIVEGKTLLIALAFASEVEILSGSLPVPIQPEASGGQQLIEPQELYFYPVGGRRTYRVILSAPLDSVMGSHTLRVRARSAAGRAQDWTFPYFIERGPYRSTSLTLDEDFSAPPPDVAARMRRDFQTDVEILKRVTARRWTMPFVRPVAGRDNDNFGVRRTVNGTKRYRHIGLDFRAATGTPVQAINDGTVALSMEQWTAGHTIIIDHGGSIFSKYNHLSERRVQAGQTVTRGQVIALSGRSGGQNSPPHLHLDTFINRTAVDPEDFMRTAAQLISI